jgi:DNA-binding MarR family transcriptional regulator
MPSNFENLSSQVVTTNIVVMTTILKSDQVQSSPSDVTELLGFRLLRLSNTLGLAAERQYMREFGISIPAWRCLSIIAAQGPLTASELVTTLRCDKAWVSRVVAQLKDGGWVKVSNDQNDGRRQRIGTTAQGTALCKRILATASARHEKLMNTLGPNKAAHFLGALEVLQHEADDLLRITEISGASK